MNRRRFLEVAAATTGAPFILRSGAHADTQCSPDGQVCDSYVNPPQVFASGSMQYMPFWCWAACISMVFAHHGHPVSQARIVSEVYGGPVNLPSGNGLTISAQLNRDWTDDYGQPFRSRMVAAYDPQMNVVAINNYQIVDALDQNRPIILGAGTHAVLLIGVRHFQTPMGPNVIGAQYRDVHRTGLPVTESVWTATSTRYAPP